MGMWSNLVVIDNMSDCKAKSACPCYGIRTTNTQIHSYQIKEKRWFDQ